MNEWIDKERRRRSGDQEWMNFFTRGDRSKWGSGFLERESVRKTERLLDWLIDLVQQWRERKLCSFSEILICGYLQLPKKKKRRVCFCGGKTKKEIKWWVLLFLLLYYQRNPCNSLWAPTVLLQWRSPIIQSLAATVAGGREELPGDSRGGGEGGGGD